MRGRGNSRSSQPRPDSPWHPLQIRTVHVYAHLAGMLSPTDAEYRQFLQAHTMLGRYHQGAITSKDKRLNQLDFDRFMPALEAELWRRVDAGLSSPPPPKYHRGYWAARCGTAGALTSRQRWWIGKHWPILRARFGYADSYLNAILSHATAGACTNWVLATSAQAEALINAIADRLQHTPSPSSVSTPSSQSSPSDQSDSSASSVRPVAAEVIQ